jgi:dTDP-4-dehydrorhamnose reductase
MNVLLTGASGQLGQELRPQLQQLGRLYQVDRAVAPGARDILIQELGDLNRVEILLNRTRPDIIVNAAAYTAVDRAEDDRESAFRINGELPACLARWTKRNDRLLLHYSTDYVFSGDAIRPCSEKDAPGPLNVYGESKLAGEEAVAASVCRHLILRTSWVYSGHGNNFVLTMLRLARERPSLSIVSDQTGCPTWARNLASVSREVIEQYSEGGRDRGMQGVYHYCDADAVSWFEFARAIFSTAKRAGLLQHLPEMTAVPSSGFPQKARRPLNSVLDTTRIQKDLGIEPARLEPSLQSCLMEMVENEQQETA